MQIFLIPNNVSQVPSVHFCIFKFRQLLKLLKPELALFMVLIWQPSTSNQLFCSSTKLGKDATLLFSAAIPLPK